MQGLPEPSRVWPWALRWCLFALLWLILVDSRRWQELALGAAAVSLAVLASAIVLRPGGPRPERTVPRLVRGIGLRRLARVPVRLVIDNVILVGAVARRLRGRQVYGRFRAAPHRPEAARDTAAGRAATELLGSLQPNRYVVGIDPDEQTILIHELVPTDEPLDPFAPR